MTRKLSASHNLKEHGAAFLVPGGLSFGMFFIEVCGFYVVFGLETVITGNPEEKGRGGIFPVKMSSVEPQREKINEQLTPAEETFTEFKVIIVKSEEEMDGQRRLPDFSRIPLDLSQYCVCKEEGVSTDISNQEGNSTLDQEEPEPLQIKQEQEELEHQQFKEEEEQLCISKDEEQIPRNIVSVKRRGFPLKPSTSIGTLLQIKRNQNLCR
ncbi:uncharacterized protein LOC124879068 isoform X3 [Girardinichthys multiradiatus]|uniref:uncharacterized protein LOC124879068 isoform X3 n=1 Tax=Girardinichthys multiradiatus TaxID=208333 RepID=UPI001FAE172E|nr:uncharacterized protein LOC124879068 isoform X3 [Girardinichthys multiradiatus]